MTQKEAQIKIQNILESGRLNKKEIYQEIGITHITFNKRLSLCSWRQREIDIIEKL